MKNTSKLIGLCGCLLFMGTGGTAYGSPQHIPDALAERLPGIQRPALPLPAPEKETEFTMRIIKPAPGAECKIMYVTPDPSIDYKIRIYDPQSRSSFIGSTTRRR